MMQSPRSTEIQQSSSEASFRRDSDTDSIATKPPARVTVRMIGELGSAIDEIQEITGSANPSEVVRRAIVIYHTLVKERMKGNNPIIEKNNNGELERVPIFL